MQIKNRAQDKWCKHRLKIVAHKPGLATVRCTVCNSVSIQTYTMPSQYEDLIKACKNTRQVDILIERMKHRGNNEIKPQE